MKHDSIMVAITFVCRLPAHRRINQVEKVAVKVAGMQSHHLFTRNNYRASVRTASPWKQKWKLLTAPDAYSGNSYEKRRAG